MAAHLTEKENYLRMLRGEVPEYVPTFTFGKPIGPPALAPLIGGFTGEKIDMFGVTFVTESNAGCGALPKPGVFILDDIRKWRDVIKRPAILDEIDWEMCAKKDLDNWDPDVFKTANPHVGNGYFQILMSFMGFTNGLIACYEEPEEVKELLNFILDLNLEMGKNFIHYYKPEKYSLADDIAHERAPFVSEAIFKDLFEPMWKKNVEIFLDAGCYAEHHNCGRFEPFVESIVDMGFCAWNPAQPKFNDLPGIKEKYKGKLAICGGFEGNGFVSWPDTTEERIRAEVRRTMDLLAPGGGFAFGGGIMGAPDNEEVKKRNGWIRDEYEKNKFKYYN